MYKIVSLIVLLASYNATYSMSKTLSLINKQKQLTSPVEQNPLLAIITPAQEEDETDFIKRMQKHTHYGPKNSFKNEEKKITIGCKNPRVVVKTYLKNGNIEAERTLSRGWAELYVQVGESKTILVKSKALLGYDEWNDSIRNFALSPDHSKILIINGDPCALRCYDVKTKTMLYSKKFYLEKTDKFAISNDGNLIAFSYEEGSTFNIINRVTNECKSYVLEQEKGIHITALDFNMQGSQLGIYYNKKHNNPEVLLHKISKRNIRH